MTKFFAALKIIWELWPYIKQVVERGEAYILQRRLRKGREEISEIFYNISNPKVSDEKAQQDISSFNDLFRK